MSCATENEAHLVSFTGLLGTITAWEVNYNSRAMQIQALQAFAVIYNYVCESTTPFIISIHMQSYTHVLILFKLFIFLLWFFKNHNWSVAIPLHFLNTEKSVLKHLIQMNESRALCIWEREGLFAWVAFIFSNLGVSQPLIWMSGVCW